MHTIAIKGEGKDAMLVSADAPVPATPPGEVLIKVAYAGLNRADIMQRRGLYPAPPGAPETLGLEVSGTIEAIGSSVTQWKKGDEVCALLSGGGYAEYCTIDASQLLPVPKGFDLKQAAALPETFATVWLNVFDIAKLRPGEKFLVHGGSSGIGTTAIQLAKAFGAEVFTSAGTKEKCAFCETLGATLAVNYKTEDFVERIREATGGYGVDVILDMTGGDYVQKNFELLALDGRVVNIAFIRGREGQLNFAPLLKKRLSWIGSTLRSRTLDEKASIINSLRKNAWPLLEGGKIRPILDSEFPLEEAQKAHERMEEGLHIGKILLRM